MTLFLTVDSLCLYVVCITEYFLIIEPLIVPNYCCDSISKSRYFLGALSVGYAPFSLFEAQMVVGRVNCFIS